MKKLFLLCLLTLASTLAHADWHLVSLPIPATAPIQTVLDMSEFEQVQQIWSWNETNFTWQVYPKLDDFDELTTVHPNKGYWLKAPEGTTIDPLDMDLSSISDRVTSLESSVLCENRSRFHTISYSHKESNLGDEIEVEGRKYFIIKAPFKDLRTQEKYSIKYPVASDYSNSYVNTYENIDHQDFAHNHCETLTISGYPVTGTAVSDSFNMRLNNFGGTLADLEYNANYWLYITINESQFSIFYGMTKVLQTVTVNANDFDFTDDFDYDLIVHQPDIIQAIDDLIDYIEIEKIN